MSPHQLPHHRYQRPERLPRWLIAFFSAGVSSAQVTVKPSGWRIGS